MQESLRKTWLLTYLSLMRITLELEFPDEKADLFVRLLQFLPPGLTAHFSRPDLNQSADIAGPESAELTDAEEKQLLHELFGAWKSDVSGEEMVRQIYEARQSNHRAVDL